MTTQPVILATTSATTLTPASTTNSMKTASVKIQTTATRTSSSESEIQLSNFPLKGYIGIGISLALILIISTVSVALYLRKKQSVKSSSNPSKDVISCQPEIDSVNDVYSVVAKPNNKRNNCYAEIDSENAYQNFSPTNNSQLTANVLYDNFDIVTNENNEQTGCGRANCKISQISQMTENILYDDRSTQKHEIYLSEDLQNDSIVYAVPDKKNKHSAIASNHENNDIYAFAENDPNEPYNGDAIYSNL